MKFSEHFDPKTREYFQAFELGDFEYKKPMEYYKYALTLMMMFLHKIPKITAEKCSEEYFYRVITPKSISDNWKILLANLNLKKKEQVKLLKEEMLSPKSLLSLYAEAEKEGYTLSQYTSELLPNGTDEYSLPIAIHKKDDGGIEIIGKSGLTDGQLKEIVENRKCLIAKFLDKGEKWHCLITTYDSLKGKEKWNNNQPHFHYISSNFGISREEVVSQIKSGKYKLNNLPHIQLEGYGKQPK